MAPGCHGALRVGSNAPELPFSPKPPHLFLFRGVLGDFEQALTSAAALFYFVHTKYVLLASQLRLPRACWMAHEDGSAYI